MNPNYRYLLAAALLGGGAAAWAAHTPVISPNYGMRSRRAGWQNQ